MLILMKNKWTKNEVSFLVEVPQQQHPGPYEVHPFQQHHHQGAVILQVAVTIFLEEKRRLVVEVIVIVAGAIITTKTKIHVPLQIDGQNWKQKQLHLVYQIHWILNLCLQEVIEVMVEVVEEDHSSWDDDNNNNNDHQKIKINNIHVVLQV